MHVQITYPETAFPEPASGRPAPAIERPTEDSLPASPPSFTSWLLLADDSPSLRGEVTRFVTGLSLSAVYGLALGARAGGAAIFAHAAGVPLAVLAVSALGVPALYIVLALFDAPIEPAQVASAAARSAASTGLVLAGLAPVAALYVVTSDGPGGAMFAGAAGLVTGGVLGLRAFLREMSRATASATDGTRLVASLAFAAFSVFATALAVRVWWSALPLFGGAS